MWVTDNQNGGGQHGNQGGRETGFEEIGDGPSSLVTEGTGEDTGTYKYVSFSSSSLLSPSAIPWLLDPYGIPRGVRLISGHPLTVDRPRMEVRMIVSPPCPVDAYANKQEPSLTTDSVS